MVADRPNILVIMTDQHNRQFMGCAGNQLVRTPHLDRLAAEGMRFDAAYCAAPLCVPSRMSFMTTRTPSQNRVWDNTHILSSSIPTWCHWLGAAGYETSMLGRMHFVGPDQYHGFENRPIGEYHSRHPGTPEAGGPRWQRFPGSASGQQRVAVEIAGRGRTTYQYADDRITDAAVSYLHAHAGDRERPFAAVVGLLLPHCPFIAPRELFDYYLPRVDVPRIESAQPASVTRFRRHRDILDLPEERVRVARAAYYGLVEYMDRSVGRVLSALQDAGLEENTLVLYVSDHGEAAGAHGCWWKSTFYEESVGVPLLARWPGRIPAGSLNTGPCSLLDLGVTFADLAGAPSPDTSDGVSLAATLQGDAASPRDVLSEFAEAKHTGGTFYPARMIRRGHYKLWQYADSEGLPPALFDLAADPGEVQDLAGSPAHSVVREALLESLHADWDPGAVLAGSLQATVDRRTIAAWGAAVRPANPDVLELPPADYEDQVELL